MKPAPLFLASALLAFTACDRTKSAARDHDHGHAADGAHVEHARPDASAQDHDEAHAGEVSFDAATGLVFSASALAALQPETVVARAARRAPPLALHGRVFALSPAVRASVHLPAADADALTHAAFASARLEHLDRTESAATGFVEALFTLEPATAARLGEFVTLTAHLPPVDGVAVPLPAVLKTTAGTFVYVQHGDAWRRSAVQLVSLGDEALVTSGLDAGATVLVSPVHAFWLTELRLTKGGGHSH